MTFKSDNTSKVLSLLAIVFQIVSIGIQRVTFGSYSGADVQSKKRLLRISITASTLMLLSAVSMAVAVLRFCRIFKAGKHTKNVTGNAVFLGWWDIAVTLANAGTLFYFVVKKLIKPDKDEDQIRYK